MVGKPPEGPQMVMPSQKAVATKNAWSNEDSAADGIAGSAMASRVRRCVPTVSSLQLTD